MNQTYGTLQTSGCELFSVASGDGQPIVFVHGTLGSYNDFEKQIPEFSKSYRVIAYSRRYHPPNNLPLGTPEYRIDEHVEDLRNIITAMGGSAHVVGSSYGGYVALMLALREPRLFRTLVLGEPPILPLLKQSQEGSRLLNDFIQNTFDPARAAFEKNDLRGGVACFVDGVTGQKGMFDKLAPEVQGKLLDAGPSLRLEFVTEFARYMPDIPSDQLSHLSLDVLLLEGRLSPRFFHVITNELAQAIPGTTRRVIPRTGHTMHSGNAEEYNRVVFAFLQKLQAVHD